MDGKLKLIHGAWIPAQICLERICINPKGVRQRNRMCRRQEAHHSRQFTRTMRFVPRLILCSASYRVGLFKPESHQAVATGYCIINLSDVKTVKSVQLPDKLTFCRKEPDED